MFQRLFQIIVKYNSLYAIDSSMPGMLSISNLPKKSFTGDKQRKDVKVQDQHKRPWYTPIPHC